MTTKFLTLKFSAAKVILFLDDFIVTTLTCLFWYIIIRLWMVWKNPTIPTFYVG